MDNLFSESWMQILQSKWNAEPKIVEPLANAHFNSTIGYGFKGKEYARGMMVIKDGVVAEAGGYDGRTLDWDLRAQPEKWQAWIEEGFGLLKLGPAVATGTLQFAAGNYRQMIRDPKLSHPFLEHFKLMSDIGLDS